MSIPDSISEQLAEDERASMTTEEFEAALGELLRSANDHDVELGRAFDFRGDDGGPDWMVEITELEQRD